MSICHDGIELLYPEAKEVSLIEFEDCVCGLRRRSALLDMGVDEILDSLDSVSRQLLNRDNELIRAYGPDTVSFVSSFLSRRHLEELIQIQRIDPKSYDRFVKVSAKKSIRKMPMGVVSQWIAGNVPLLGILTLVLSMIAKNINVMRLSSQQGDYLTPFLRLLLSSGAAGRTMSENVVVVRYNSKDRGAAESQSLLSDCRLIFGGRKTVEEIVELEHQWHVEDIVLGPRISMGVIDPKFLSPGGMNRLASDILLFDQLACSSPQFVFVKNNGRAEAIAKDLYDSMKSMLPNFPRHPLSYSETFDICEARTRLMMQGAKIFCSTGTRLTVSLSPSFNEGSICGNGFVQLVTFDDLNEIYGYIPKNVQTVVVSLGEGDFARFTEEASRYGVCRYPVVGESNLFEVPWDGIEALSRLSSTIVRTDP